MRQLSLNSSCNEDSAERANPPLINTYMNIKSLLDQQYEISHKEEVRVVEGAAAANSDGMSIMSRVTGMSVRMSALHTCMNMIF